MTERRDEVGVARATAWYLPYTIHKGDAAAQKQEGRKWLNKMQWSLFRGLSAVSAGLCIGIRKDSVHSSEAAAAGAR
jgi:hypothetical protein